MRILTFSTLYPNSARPKHGIFVETRLRQLLGTGCVEARVVAPVPWFPSRSPHFGRYALLARAPREEQRHGIHIAHPRYLTIPTMGMTVAPFLLAAGASGVINRMIGSGYDFDLIDAHYFYPDGVAATIMGQKLNKPVVITARGSDINLLPRYALPRRMIAWAARRAAGLITVSKALKERLMHLGIDAERIAVLRNGVDTHLFYPLDRAAERERLGITGVTLLSVGDLVPHKGHDLVLKVLANFPQSNLLVIGDGPEEARLRELTTELKLEQRVRFLGTMPQEELCRYYCAADALVLASSREGWPNVLLEAMACGTPVVATRVGGTPEIVSAPDAGVLAEKPCVPALVEALKRLFQNYPDRSLTRRYAEQFGWDETVQDELRLFERVMGKARRT